MNNPRTLILAALVCAALAVAGCTTAPAPSQTATPAPAVSLPSLAFTSADLPPGYVLTMERQKNASEMSDLALDLGWKAGYVVEYTDSLSPEGSQYVLTQTLTTYPEKSIPDIIAYISKVDHSYPNHVYTDIPPTDLALGENSRVFIGAYNPPQTMVPAPTTASPHAASEVLTTTSERGANGQGFVEIIFSKGTTLEVIRMSGPVPNDREMIALAQKAYAKIP